MSLKLRPAGPGDMRRYFAWANDPLTRAQSYRSGRISWPEHRTWFASRLGLPRRVRLYVALAPGPAGQIRFEKARAGVAHVGVGLDRAHRGRGLASPLIRAGCRRAVRDLGVRRVLAYIKKGNAASLAAFERAGFSRVREVCRAGAVSVLCAWRAP